MDFSRVRAVLFDLDGTLVDTAPDIARAVDAALAELDRAPAGEEQVRQWIGNGVRMLMVRALTGGTDHPEPAAELLDDAQERFRAHYTAAVYDQSSPYDHVIDALEALHRAGFALGVVTNKPWTYSRAIVDGMGLGDTLDVIVGGDSTDAGKPDPGPMRLAMEQLNVSPGEVLMVGDSLTDVQAAHAAGIPVVCVPYGYRRGVPLEELGADGLIRHLGELPGLLQLQEAGT